MAVNLTLVIYLLVLIVVAYISFRRIGNHHDFFVAGKSGSTLAVTGSLLATILGGSAVIGAIDAAPRMQWAISWFMICAAVGLLSIVPFAARISKLGRFTLPDLLESMHGKGPKKIASLIIPVAWLGIVAAQIIASAKILESFASIPYQWGVLLSGVVFIGYTIIGGQFSILKTDFLQSILVIGGLVLVAFFALRYETAKQVTIDPVKTMFNNNFSPFDLFVLVLTYSTTFTTGPDIYSRLFCAKNPTTIRKSLIYSSAILIPVALTIGFLGVSATALNHNHEQGTLLVALIKLVLPGWAVSVMVLALLSAVLSSADTTLLSASVIVSDLVQKGKHGARTLKTTRLIILAIGLLSVAIAWHYTSIIGILLIALAVYAGAFTLPVISGLLKLKFKPEYLSAAIISGGALALMGKLVDLFQKGNLANLLLVISFVVSGTILFIGHLKNTDDQKKIHV